MKFFLKIVKPVLGRRTTFRYAFPKLTNESYLLLNPDPQSENEFNEPFPTGPKLIANGGCEQIHGCLVEFAFSQNWNPQIFGLGTFQIANLMDYVITFANIVGQLFK